MSSITRYDQDARGFAAEVFYFGPDLRVAQDFAHDAGGPHSGAGLHAPILKTLNAQYPGVIPGL